jgi:hypothetical protein
MAEKRLWLKIAFDTMENKRPGKAVKGIRRSSIQRTQGAAEKKIDTNPGSVINFKPKITPYSFSRFRIG